jgi:hypothetical protein
MYHLASKTDPTNHGKVLREPFATEDQAVNRARALLTSGEAFACVLDDEKGTVADDAEMAERCKRQ